MYIYGTGEAILLSICMAMDIYGLMRRERMVMCSISVEMIRFKVW